MEMNTYSIRMHKALKNYVRSRALEEHTTDSAYIRSLIVEDRKRYQYNGQKSLQL